MIHSGPGYRRCVIVYNHQVSCGDTWFVSYILFFYFYLYRYAIEDFTEIINAYVSVAHEKSTHSHRNFGPL